MLFYGRKQKNYYCKQTNGFFIGGNRNAET